MQNALYLSLVVGRVQGGYVWISSDIFITGVGAKRHHPPTNVFAVTFF